MTTLAEPSLFTLEERGDITRLRFRHHRKLAGTDLSLIRGLWKFLDAQKTQPSKVLVIEAPTEVLTPENLDRFWSSLLHRPETATGPLAPGSDAAMYLMREENALARLIDGVRATSAFTIAVLQGQIDLPFLGPALAMDYRIVADDTVFANRCLDLGLPTCGAVPWFLIRHLGQGKALDILLSSRDIPADEALELKLVNEVVPRADLEARTLRTAERFAAKPKPGLIALKRSLIATEGPLVDYLTQEKRIFEASVHQERAG